MRHAIRLASSLALLAAPLAAAAQDGTVRGRIADTTDAPVTGATVVLSPAGLRTRSDERCAYTLSRVPAGSYTLVVRRLGYLSPPVPVTVGEGETVERDVVMQRAPQTLSTVEVLVGSRARHTAADELAVPVDVFGIEQIRAQGTTETAQILAQLAPSVNFPRQSVSDASEIVRPFTMRGLSPDHTLVLLNGRRRHRTALIHYYGAGQGAGSSGVDMNAFPASAIERMEILRDGAAAQYGSDAIAGVVNVVLRSGAFEPFVRTEVGEYVTGEENPAALPDGDSRPSFPRDGRTVNVNGGGGSPSAAPRSACSPSTATASPPTAPAPTPPTCSPRATPTRWWTAIWCRRTTPSRSPTTTGATASRRT